MYPFVDRFLARAPRLYAWLAGLRRSPNVEKIVFLAVVRRGDIVVDVGANNGYYTALFAHLVGALGHVHAFEPVPMSFEQLTRRTRPASRYANVTLNQLALGDEAGAAEMLWPGTDLGQASLIAHQHGSWNGAAAVHRHACGVDTLDAYAKRHRIDRLALVKCDVEGGELAVLRGGIETLRRFTPLLHLEICGAWSEDFGCEPPDIVRYLRPLGYDTFRLVDGAAVTRLLEPEADLRSLHRSASVNLLCAADRDRLRFEALGKLRRGPRVAR